MIKLAEEKKEEDKEKEEKEKAAEEAATSNPIEEARKLVAEIRTENKITRGLIERREQIMAEEMVSGSSSAGQTPPEKTEETPGDYAKKVMANDTTETGA